MHMYISGIRVERKLLDKKMRSKEQRAEREREGTRIHIIWHAYHKSSQGKNWEEEKSTRGSGEQARVEEEESLKIYVKIITMN